MDRSTACPAGQGKSAVAPARHVTLDLASAAVPITHPTSRTDTLLADYLWTEHL